MWLPYVQEPHNGASCAADDQEIYDAGEMSVKFSVSLTSFCKYAYFGLLQSNTFVPDTESLSMAEPLSLEPCDIQMPDRF